MNEGKFESALRELIEYQDVEEDGVGIKDVASFEDAGILTNNKGLVVTLSDGSQFQVTIVQSQQGTEPVCDECLEPVEEPGSAGLKGGVVGPGVCNACIAKFESADARRLAELAAGGSKEA